MIAQVVNRPDYIPRNPTSDGLSNVFDTQFTAVQPYLHKVSQSTHVHLSAISSDSRFRMS